MRVKISYRLGLQVVNVQSEKIRASIQDGTQKTISVMVRFKSVAMARLGQILWQLGDGAANETRDDSTDGWTHDSKMPGDHRGWTCKSSKANYLRVLFTANYDVFAL